MFDMMMMMMMMMIILSVTSFPVYVCLSVCLCVVNEVRW